MGFPMFQEMLTQFPQFRNIPQGSWKSHIAKLWHFDADAKTRFLEAIAMALGKPISQNHEAITVRLRVALENGSDLWRCRFTYDPNQTWIRDTMKRLEHRMLGGSASETVSFSCFAPVINYYN